MCIRDSTYSSSTSNCITVGHGLKNGDRIKFEPNSITMTCTCDNNTVSQSYPRPDDPAGQGWLEVSNVATGTFDVNVGKSPAVSYTAANATYDADTGFLTMDIGDNDLKPGSKHSVHNASYTASTGIMTMNVGNDQYHVRDADYSAISGDLELTIGGHNLETGQKVKIANNSLHFSCDMDGHLTTHSYPRQSDPAHDKQLEVSHVTDTSITVNVGTSPKVTLTPTAATFTPNTGVMALTVGDHDLQAPTVHSPTSAAYDPNTGIVTLTLANHGFAEGDKVRLADNALTMSCNFGGATGGAAQKTYPRSTDPISGKFIPITNVTANTFDIQCLAITP